MHTQNLIAYDVIKREKLRDIHSEGYLLKHKKSGARVLLAENGDDNKVFFIGFRTPPGDSTGLPHILEHSVLCGSKNFPARDPFVELAKGSLNTFLNAMTYPDKTVYPVASCNDKDFQNLMHVYMDAVLYPNIYAREEIFRQEGWSYKLDSPEGRLEYNGVVYNEMKGAFSSPESVLDRVVLNTLFPDTAYSCESGGDPEVIPTLTYGQFLDFHRTYYHPSNSYIYLYGDMDMEQKLDWLDREYLCHFEKREVNSEIGFQEPFAEMKELEMPYSIACDESEEENTYLSYSKVISTSLDKELYLAFQILDYALLSAPGAPLKKTLTEAGIGKDIMGTYDNGIYQPIFSVISKNAEGTQKEEFVRVIEDVLRGVVKDGTDPKAIEAGINYHEFRYREADFGNYPKGLMYGLQMLDSWLYDDGQPFLHIEVLELFEYLKQQVGSRYYEELIQKYLLDNTHGAIVTVVPEKGRTARIDAELEERLRKYKAGLSDAEVAELVAATERLEEYQSAPEKEEDLERIPVLNREDISREPMPVYNEELQLAGVPVVFHEVETNGIGYADVLFDLSGVREDELPYVGILQSVLGLVDTEHYGYGDLFHEIHMHTGGIATSLELYNDVTKVREKEFKATLEIRGKALYPKLPKIFEMMGEILTASKLDDVRRIKEILDMAESRLLMRFQSSGHTTAALRALSYASPSAKYRDMTGGIEFYGIIQRLTKNYEEEKEHLSRILTKLAKQIFRPDNMMLSYTAAREGLDGLGQMIEGLSGKLFAGAAEDTLCRIRCEKKNEGFKTASKVQYVARAGNFIDNGAGYTGVLHILKVILSYDYLWQNIRVKGGAYGCVSHFSRTGEAFFASYRDPNLARTNQVYEEVVEYLKHFDVSGRDMTRYIIGTMSNLDQPLTPGAKGERSMNLYMSKVSAGMLKEERNQILDATQDDVRSLARVAEAMLRAGQLCVIGNEAKIEENREMFDVITHFQVAPPTEGEGNGTKL